MRTIILILLTTIFASCGTSSNQEMGNNTEQESTTTALEQQEGSPQEDVEDASDEKSLIIGTWSFTDTKLKVEQIITYNEDGSYNMKMAAIDVNGTWELKDDILITKSRPDADGQKKTITKLNDKELWTIWEPKNGTARELKYTRK